MAYNNAQSLKVVRGYDKDWDLAISNAIITLCWIVGLFTVVVCTCVIGKQLILNCSGDGAVSPRKRRNAKWTDSSEQEINDEIRDMITPKAQLNGSEY